MKNGLVLLAHGSRRKESNDHIKKMVNKLNKSPVIGIPVEPGFMQFSEPDIFESITKLYKKGITNIHILPYFLSSGNHTKKDVPKKVGELKNIFPDIKFKIHKSFGMNREIPNLLEEIITGIDTGAGINRFPTNPKEIERLSLEWINNKIGKTSLTAKEKNILVRVIHSTADFSLINNFRIHKDAVKTGLKILKKKTPIITDVEMVKAGIRKAVPVLCAIRNKKVQTLAEKTGRTRAYESMQYMKKKINGNIVVIGNAPTALNSVLDMAEEGVSKPGLIIGVPVGLVGAAESKERLIKSKIPYITITGNRGGSNIAAAIMNALIIDNM